MKLKKIPLVLKMTAMSFFGVYYVPAFGQGSEGDDALEEVFCRQTVR